MMHGHAHEPVGSVWHDSLPAEFESIQGIVNQTPEFPNTFLVAASNIPFSRSQKQIESIPAAALRKLSICHWPGNIRELGNFIERSVILTHGTTLQARIAELANAQNI